MAREKTRDRAGICCPPGLPPSSAPSLWGAAPPYTGLCDYFWSSAERLQASGQPTCRLPWHLGQVAQLSWASVSSSVKWRGLREVLPWPPLCPSPSPPAAPPALCPASGPLLCRACPTLAGSQAPTLKHNKVTKWAGPAPAQHWRLWGEEEALSPRTPGQPCSSEAGRPVAGGCRTGGQAPSRGTSQARVGSAVALVGRVPSEPGFPSEA